MNTDAILGPLTKEQTKQLVQDALGMMSDDDAMLVILNWADGSGMSEELAARLEDD